MQRAGRGQGKVAIVTGAAMGIGKACARLLEGDVRETRRCERSGQADAAAYCASKGAIRLLAKSAALHGIQYGVRVNSIHPGYIEAMMVQRYVAPTGNERSAREALAHLRPLGHLGEPDDIARGVLYLASDESKFVTGAELAIAGAYTSS